MLTQPKAAYQMTKLQTDGSISEFWGPVPQNLWVYFSTSLQALAVAAKIKEDGIDQEPTIIDGLGVALYIPVKYLSRDERMWLVYGPTPQPDGVTRVYEEWCGLQSDTKVREGGDDLEARVISTTLVELHWSEESEETAAMSAVVRTRPGIARGLLPIGPSVKSAKS